MNCARTTRTSSGSRRATATSRAAAPWAWTSSSGRRCACGPTASSWASAVAPRCATCWPPSTPATPAARGTLHANAAADVPVRLHALAATAGVAPAVVDAQLLAGVDVVVHVERHGDRRGDQVDGRDGGGRAVIEVGVVGEDRGRAVVLPALVRGKGRAEGFDRLRALLGAPACAADRVVVSGPWAAWRPRRRCSSRASCSPRVCSGRAVARPGPAHPAAGADVTGAGPPAGPGPLPRPGTAGGRARRAGGGPAAGRGRPRDGLGAARRGPGRVRPVPRRRARCRVRERVVHVVRRLVATTGAPAAEALDACAAGLRADAAARAAVRTALAGARTSARTVSALRCSGWSSVRCWGPALGGPRDVTRGSCERRGRARPARGRSPVERPAGPARRGGRPVRRS